MLNKVNSGFIIFLVTLSCINYNIWMSSAVGLGSLLEAKIVLPKVSDSGESLDHIRIELEKKLLETFGGFTQSTQTSGWVDSNATFHQDVAWAYEFVVPQVKKDEPRNIAKWLKGAAQLKRIFLKQNGQVSFIS